MFNKKKEHRFSDVIFVETGKQRPVKVGEWFLNVDRKVQRWSSASQLGGKQIILKPVRVERDG